MGEHRQRGRARSARRGPRPVRADDAAHHHLGRRQDGQDRPGRRLAECGPAHGREAADAAAETARRTFGEGGAGEDLPSIEVARGDLERGLPAADLLHRSGLAASKSEARRLIKGGGARVNGDAIRDDAAVLTLADVAAEGYIKLSAGRKKHALVRPR